MTHPLTPREKVRQIIDGALNSAIPEPWEVANRATDAILTALASGSGDHAELARLAEAATPGPWTNTDALRGEKKSVWVADTAREETERDGVTPSRYGPSRTTICNALASNYSLPDGGYKTLDPYPNAAFIAAANPATVLALLAEVAALRERVKLEVKLSVDNYVRATARATEAERKLAEADKALELAASRFDEIYEAAEVDDVAYRNEATIHGINGLADVAQAEIRTFLSKEAERG